MGRQFVEISCHDCILTVEAGDPDFPCVEVRLLQTHPDAGGFRFHVREAWRVLRGEGRQWWEFYSRDEIDRFIAALESAKPTLPLPLNSDVLTDGTKSKREDQE